jgi:Rrf2 family protein
MIKLNRTTEYSLVALRYMSRKKANTSAREISDTYGLPFEITAKTLQRLKDTGIIQSVQGAHGGYTIKRDLNEVSLAEFLSLMEGKSAVVACTTSTPDGALKCGCEYQSKCEIRDLMGGLNQRVTEFLASIRLAELTGGTL